MSSLTHEQRREAQRDLARRSILEATEALLVDEGYDAFSIRRLVERCGYAAPSIYHYFGDKDGLIDALLEEVFAKLMRQLRRVPRGADPVAYIRGLGLAYVRFGRKHPTHFQLLSAPRTGDQSPPPSGEKARKMLEGALVALIESGRLLCSDARTAGQALSALCHGLVWGRIARPEHEWAKDLDEQSIDALLRGFVAPDAARSREGEGS